MDCRANQVQTMQGDFPRDHKLNLKGNTMARVAWFDVDHDYDPNSSIPIARSPAVLPVRVTRIGPAEDGSGELIYLADIKASWRLAVREATYLLGDSERSVASEGTWFRLECKVERDKGINTNDTLVVSTPHADGWFKTCLFKGSNHKGRGKRVDLLTEPRSCDELVKQTLDELTYDYWETGKALTAGFFRPGKSSLAGIRVCSDDFFLFGVVKNFTDCTTQLLTNSRVLQLLEETREGTIRYAHPKAGKPALKEETRDLRNALMYAAISQSLAGTADRSAKSYLGKPVVSQVEKIYCQLLNNENRRKRVLTVQDDQIAERFVASSDASGIDIAISKEQKSQLYQSLSLLGPDDRDVLVLKVLAELPLKDIALILGVTVPKVNARLEEAKRALRKSLSTNDFNDRDDELDELD